MVRVPITAGLEADVEDNGDTTYWLTFIRDESVPLLDAPSGRERVTQEQFESKYPVGWEHYCAAIRPRRQGLDDPEP
jgi:hypothetical protein